jgi:hypothetical protein
MKNKFSSIAVLFLSVIVVIIACSKESNPNKNQLKDYSFAEDFDTVSVAVAKGWVIANNSKPIGTMSWMQGYFYVSLYHGAVPGKFGGPVNYPAYGGFGANNPSFSGTDFVLTTSECGSGVANCSNWLISPEVLMKDGDEINFYTRTFVNPAVGADRMQVRVNSVNSSADVGIDSNTVGGFTNVLLDINPTLLLEGDNSYPGEWRRYSVKVSGMKVPQKSRIAFRYYVPNGGPLGPNGLGVGIDKFSFTTK